jgi:hypothetical protein
MPLSRLDWIRIRLWAHTAEETAAPFQQSFKNPFKPVSESLSNRSVRTGVMSYGSFWTHVGRSGDMSDTA